jgi:hypothetical protein
VNRVAYRLLVADFDVDRFSDDRSEKLRARVRFNRRPATIRRSSSERRGTMPTWRNESRLTQSGMIFAISATLGKRV